MDVHTYIDRLAPGFSCGRLWTVEACQAGLNPLRVSLALPEKSNMAVTESEPDPKVQKMSITFK